MTTPLVELTQVQLVQLVREAVRAELADVRGMSGAPKLLSAAQVATMVECSRERAKTLIKMLPEHVLGGCAVRIPESAHVAWLERGGDRNDRPRRAARQCPALPAAPLTTGRLCTEPRTNKKRLGSEA